ncbi:hypothetical protein HY251_02125 [bacterium]|nr:hypothetical protein [bacterium]
MGRKKGKTDAPDTRAVDLDRLDPDLQKAAKTLGFRERASVNKIARSSAHERHTEMVAVGFAALTGVAASAALTYSFLGPREKHGQMLSVAIFVALWALLAFVYSLRAKKRVGDLQKLDAAVKQKLGL